MANTDEAALQKQLRVGRPADQRGILRWVPGLYSLRHYQRSWLMRDITAGLALTAMLVPGGMAFAEAAGVPAIHGLYTTIAALVAYALFGPSRVMVLGPDSSLAPMIAAAVLPLVAAAPERAVTVAGALAILAGLFGVVAGLLRLGFITELLAKPIRHGYMNGIALTVLVSQAPKLFGFRVEGDGLFAQVIGFVSGLFAGRTNGVTLALGAGTLLILVLARRLLRIPGVLLAVAAATLAVVGLDLSERFGVAVVGQIPRGLPSFAFPVLSLDEIGKLVPAAVAIAVVAFADTSVLSRVYSTKTRTFVDPNQEMIGLGVSSVSAGLFGGFPVGSSSVRTAVAHASGSKTQLTSLVGALMITLLLVLAPRMLQDLPHTALAAVVIASAIGLFELGDLGRLWRVQRSEFLLSIAAFLGVALLDAVRGIMIAVAIALAEFIWTAWRPHYAVLGRPEGIPGYLDLKRHPAARQIPGLILFRWDAPLFFANAERFREVVLETVSSAPWTVRWVVVAAEPVTSIDVTSFDMLRELYDELEQAGVRLVFAEMKGPVKDKLRRFAVTGKVGEESFFHTLDEAVEAYSESLRATPSRRPNS